MKTSIHLPYEINPSQNRNHRYETLWKEVALELLSRHEADLGGWSLFDYGSGRGETMMLASKLGMTVRGTDLDPECVRLSSAYGPAELLNLNDPVGQFGGKVFDVVASFHVLEHVPSPVETLNHLRRLARRYVLLAVPNLATMPDLFRPERNVCPVNEGHLQSWNHSTLQNLAEHHCGLKLVGWGFDHVKVPMLSSQIPRLFGEKSAVRLETGIFRRMFPYQSASIIGLFGVVNDQAETPAGMTGLSEASA